MPMQYTICPSPVGPLLLAGEGETLCVVSFEGDSNLRKPKAHWSRDDRRFTHAREQLDEYFSGRRKAFDLPLAPRGTKFQRLIWNALLDIPYGQTRSYSEIAARIGRPGACRAVGAANGANPVPVIIPCHRVIGKNGQLTGFGGGIETKQWLLLHERRNAPGMFRQASLQV